MPIYAYRCQTCGFAKDVLQKVSDAPLSDCPSCNQPAFKKQLTAAGFQLKGTGWYATDFRGGASATSAPAVAEPMAATATAAASADGGTTPATVAKPAGGTPSAT